MTQASTPPCRILECIARDTAVLLEAPDLQAFAQRVLASLGAAMGGDCSGLACELRDGRLLVEQLDALVQQQQRRLARLHRSAYEDPQLQLPNRTRFVEQVDAAVRTGTRDHTLALLDVDDFSATNDVMGHPFGDRLLDAIARRLEADLPEGVLLARVGADIYGVFGPSTSIHPQVLLQGLQPTLIVDGMEHRLSLSCGYVRGHSLVSKTGAELVTDATMALQRAKREHRGQAVQYRAAMGAETRERARMVSDLRVAVDKDQLFLAYQPQIDLHTGALTGLEALLRWRREDGRVVAPGEFIPVAEHSGLIVALGQWVLQQACSTMRVLMDTPGAPGRMAVNVSVAQLRDPAFIHIVRTAIARAGIEGRRLELEITESVALLPTELLDSTLHALRGDGISVAIDDFGTGYSSLSSLERMPLDRIKIDRSFVRELDRPGGARIAELVAQLGHRMGLQIVAEGIEDERTLQLLRAMGCHEGQGFHIAAPMAYEELVGWMQARQGLPPSTRRA
ncbi:bifunctional diguanylate cyclase/phosphodiesterase [Xenophilus arseniciresistens]|uniref:Bifunctional diguanylate cyclase/phosphodiesterase n=1 Tax=Xenophilus arseniciresistens TaxID=1283306 RepID=A0AAE3N8M4_9BURK|nr:bifunctional diguanylate cyclase/phosphodiesterase [Xenophilus arseniciresistens]MDA7417670.1 bifunctional diguanylate cyclase/phosphodiesterase [Xenophilus arseniciresistens]